MACACKQPHGDAKKDNYQVKGDTIMVPLGSNLYKKLKTAAVQTVAYQPVLSVAGTVRAIPTQYAAIAPPFQGRVTRSYLRLGLKVKAGTPLFEISSPEFMLAQKAFFQEKSQLLQAKQTLKRQQDLAHNGVGAEKDLEEARTAFEVEKKEYENALAGIRLFGADPDRIVLGQSLVVRSPIAGEVVENKVVLGQFIKDDAASVATVAELSNIWVVGQVKEKDIGLVHQLGECNVAVPAFPDRPIKGRVYHVNEMVNEDTRSVEVLVEVQNTTHLLKPGMYVATSFVQAPISTMLVPSKTLLQDSQSSFVYVELSPGKFVRRKTEVGEARGNLTAIKSGLNNGDKVVSEGGIYLLDLQ